MRVEDIVYPHKTIDGTEDFQFVVSVAVGVSYEWDDLVAWYSPSKRMFFWLSGAGCSCNALGDYASELSDFRVGSRTELLAAVRAKHEGGYYTNDIARVSDLAAVKTFRTEG